jgi:hypothetical protein
MPRSTPLPLAAAAATALLVAGCCRPSGDGAPPAATPPSSAPVVLADLKGVQPLGGDAVTGAVNEAGTGGALAAGTARGVVIAFGARQEGPYEQAGDPVVSPDGRRLAYVTSSEGRTRVMVDGQPGPVVDSAEAPIFTKDSRHVFYLAQLRGQFMLVVDGHPGPAAAGFNGRPFQAAGSDEIVVMERPVEGRPWELVAYGAAMARRSLGPVGEVADWVPSPDGARVAVATTEPGKPSRVTVIPLATPADRQAGPDLDLAWHLEWDRAGAHLTYVGRRGDAFFVALDHKLEKLPPGDVVQAPVIVPGRAAVAVVLATGERTRVHWAFAGGAIPDEEHGAVAWLEVSADGKHLAYAAEAPGEGGGRSYLVVDGKAAPERFDRVVTPRFSPDGSKVAYRARKDGQRFVVLAGADARELRRFPPFEQVFAAAFTADGKAVAYGVKSQQQLLWRVEPL